MEKWDLMINGIVRDYHSSREKNTLKKLVSEATRFYCLETGAGYKSIWAAAMKASQEALKKIYFEEGKSHE